MFVQQTLTPQSVLTPPSTAYQRGRISLVAGTQSYAVTFSPALASTPVVVRAQVLLPGPSGAGEGFEVWPDVSTYATTGFTLWLSAAPSASTGYIEWEAST